MFEMVMYVSEIRLAEVKHTRGKGNVSARTLVSNLRYLFAESWFMCWLRGPHSVPLDCSAFPHERARRLFWELSSLSSLVHP